LASIKGLVDPLLTPKRVWGRQLIAPVHSGETVSKQSLRTFPEVDVELVRWPGDASRLAALRAGAAPRLLVVAPEAAPPEPNADCLEDWVRLPAAETDLQARLQALAARSHRHSTRPSLDLDGILHYQGGSVPLPPVEQALVAVLLERYRAVVSREALTRRAWEQRPPRRNTLDVHMVRLRRRVAPLGLEIRTVRARGYLLQGRADLE
jgi:Transcriptional regulatory protein, C terminal